MTKTELYLEGLQTAHEFLEANLIGDPEYRTYQADAATVPNRVLTYFTRTALRPEAATVGARTGLYYDGYVFVNVPVTAAPVKEPNHRSWSWPGWKTDRTAKGVVAHEVGHYVAHKFLPRSQEMSAQWRSLLQACRKPVSGYEPVPSEAWAETMRLFILNPDLLRKAIPFRYNFVLEQGLRPVERLLKKGWKRVLGNDNYVAAAERWIGAVR
jgi:hypothetical protein